MRTEINKKLYKIVAVILTVAVAFGLFQIPGFRMAARAVDTVDVYYDMQPVTSLSSMIVSDKYLFLPHGNGSNHVSNYSADNTIADVEIPDIDYAQPTLPNGCYIFIWDPGLVVYGQTPNTIQSNQFERGGYTGNVTVYTQGGEDHCPYGLLEENPDYFQYWCQWNGIHKLKGRLYAYKKADVPASAFNVTSLRELDTAMTLTTDDLVVTVTIDGVDYKVNSITVNDGSIDPATDDYSISIKFSTIDVPKTFTVIPPLNVSFNLNGHGSNAPSDQAVAHGYTASEPESPSENGYYFTGWFTEPECTNKWNFSSNVMNDMVLYAGWLDELKINTLTLPGGVTGTPYGEGIVSAGGEGDITYSMTAGTLPDGLTLNESTGAISGIPEMAGEFTFTVKAEDAYGHSDIRELTIVVNEAPVPTFKVTFEMQGHGTSPENQIISEGEKAVKPDDPSEEGWDFEGWFKDADCTVVWDFDSDIVTGDVKIYAGWKEKPKPEPEPVPEPEPEPEPKPKKKKKTPVQQALPEPDDHEHNFEWVTVKEATDDADGEMAYQCTVCGETEYSVPVTAYYTFNKNTADRIKSAPQNGATEIFTSRWLSFHKMVMDALSARPDESLSVSYLSEGYKGERREFTIPAGTDIEAVTGGITFTGFQFLADRVKNLMASPLTQAAAQTAQAGQNAQTGQAAQTTQQTGQATEAAGGRQITIPGGVGSETVAALLENSGLVDSARNFDSFLCNNGYDRKIRSGSRFIPDGASWEDIAQILTGMRTVTAPARVATAAAPAQTAAATDEPEQTAAAPAQNTTRETASAENTQTAAPAQTTAAPAENRNTAEDTDRQSSDIVRISIPNGSDSMRVARLMESAGLIDSARAFDNYLCDNGYDTRIRAGEKNIRKDADEREMAEALVR